MELDDLRSAWDNISDQTEKQHHLTPKIINQMTQKKYYPKVTKVAYPEIVGVGICLIAAAFIGAVFYKLDTLFLQGVGMVSILLLLTIAVISMLSIRQFNIKEDINKPYAETLRIFATQKLIFFKMQKVNIVLSYLLLVTIIILLSKLFNGRDITDSKYFWASSFSIGYIFLLAYARFVSKYYQKALSQAEDLLQELQP
jgi:glucan phosphoethanolaminetransferase (alkaline phosphatase superfamily)